MSINFNMGCIETVTNMENTFNAMQINFNMGCIETIKGLAKEMNLDGLTLTWDVLKPKQAF